MSTADTELQLWLGPNQEIACPRVSCAGEELLALIFLSNGWDREVTLSTGETFERIMPVVAQEMGVLLEVAGRDLACRCGRVRWDVRSQMYTSRAGTATRS